MRVPLNKVRVRELADGTLSGSFTIDSVDEGLYDTYKHKMRGGALPCLDFLDNIEIRPIRDDVLNDLEELLYRGISMINREKPPIAEGCGECEKRESCIEGNTELNKPEEVK